MMDRKRISLFISAMLTSAFFYCSTHICHHHEKIKPALLEAIEHSGDALQIAIPLSSMVYTLLKRDPIGAYQLCASVTHSTALTWLFKIPIAKKRPNGGKNSMPSGHTSLAFAGASFFLIRYGISFSSLVMVGAASFTALSRVLTHWHDGADIIIGFLVGLFSALYCTKNALKFKKFAL